MPATVCEQGVEFVSFIALTLMAITRRLTFLETTSIIIQLIIVFRFGRTKCARAFYVFAFFFATAPQCKYDGRRTPTVTLLGKQTRPYCLARSNTRIQSQASRLANRKETEAGLD